MFKVIKNILSAGECEQFQTHLSKDVWQDVWIDGAKTAGEMAKKVKQNEQLDELKEPAISLSNHILRALTASGEFMSLALPDKIYPPMFNRYQNGGFYGQHVDNAILHIKGTQISMRGDLSATLFLTPPEEYEGGELIIINGDKQEQYKLPMGDMVVYPTTFLHEVKPVTKGKRVCAVFWTQSMVREQARRDILYELDTTIQSLQETSLEPVRVQLSNIYHNLLRDFSQI